MRIYLAFERAVVSRLDALSLIVLIVLAVAVLAGAVGWLRAKLVGREYGHHAHWSGYVWDALGGLLLGGFLLLGVKGFIDSGIKEAVFDGWLDSVADSIDGTSDREERIARHRQGGSRGPLMST